MRLIRKIHRYFALVLGLGLLAWIVSGIMMMLPEPTPDALSKPKAHKHDFSTVTLSPADVTRRLQELHGADGEIRRIELRPLRDKLVFEVRARGQNAVLLDAHTAELIEVTPELATALARENLKGDLGPPQIERLDQHDATYPWGALPVYKLSYEDGRGTIAYVALADANVRVTDRSKQTWHFLLGFHNFNPLSLVFGEDIRYLTMLLAAILSLVILATGYYMEFSPRSRNRGKK